jgi:hypothetical protein
LQKIYRFGSRTDSFSTAAASFSFRSNEEKEMEGTYSEDCSGRAAESGQRQGLEAHIWQPIGRLHLRGLNRFFGNLILFQKSQNLRDRSALDLGGALVPVGWMFLTFNSRYLVTG